MRKVKTNIELVMSRADAQKLGIFFRLNSDDRLTDFFFVDAFSFNLFVLSNRSMGL